MWIALLLSLFAFAGVAQDESPADPAVDALLEQMRLAGDGLRTLESRVEFEEYDFNFDANPIRPGRVWLRRDGEGETTFRVLLFGSKDGPDGAFRPGKIEYRLKGDELVDRNYVSKTQVTRKLPPEQAGRDLLKLGEGPFPLPIGQPVAEVRRQFTVSQIDPDQPDADALSAPAMEGAKRLRLTPRAGTPLAEDFSQVEIDVDPATGLPMQVATMDAGGQTLRLVRLYDPSVNGDVEDADFELEDIDLSDWNVSVER